MICVYGCNGSGGKIFVQTNFGDGNSAEFTVTCKDGQFPFARFEKSDDGFAFTIIGEFEFLEMLAAMASSASQIQNVSEWISPS